jgi:AcrR family transcriptional regulator
VTAPDPCPVPLSPLAQRRDAVARAIARTALELFARRGFDRVSVNDVAAAAGISQRTFFRYFGSKDDVLLGYQRRLDERLLGALRARPTVEGPVTALRRAYVETSTVAPENRAGVLLQARVLAEATGLLARSRGEQAAAAATIAELLATRMGTDADDRRPVILAAAFSGVARAAWDRWVQGGGTGDPAAEIAEALALVEDGLGTLDRPQPHTEG